MIRVARNLAFSLAAAGLVIAQPAMAVRSADSLPAPGAKVTAVAGLRGASPVGQSEQLKGNYVVQSVILFLIIGGIVALSVSGHNHHHNHHSPG
jgi:hypothetical protein